MSLGLEIELVMTTTWLHFRSPHKHGGGGCRRSRNNMRKKNKGRKMCRSRMLIRMKTIRRSSFSFLPLPSRIGCGDLTIFWFLHVYVPVFQYSSFSYPLLLGHRTHIIIRFFVCIVLYIASAWGLGFLPFWQPSLVFPFWHSPLTLFLYTLVSRILFLQCCTWWHQNVCLHHSSSF